MWEKLGNGRAFVRTARRVFFCFVFLLLSHFFSRKERGDFITRRVFSRRCTRGAVYTRRGEKIFLRTEEQKYEEEEEETEDEFGRVFNAARLRVGSLGDA
jgi:hypothetical protein|tara:strand:- start:7285 stop:7584 length:300 start_codon:yes stop_codon:yes gene_type:complete